MTKVMQVKLFTASACPMGRTMGTVIQEVKDCRPELSIDIYYIDIQVEEANVYRIKQNPTTLLLSEDGKELVRVEGFKETSEMLQLIEQSDSRGIHPSEPIEANRESQEKYVIYLYDEQGTLVPVEVVHRNLTSIKTPRITLLQLLLKSIVHHLHNPFPVSSSLELVQFNGDKGTITLRGASDTTEDERMKMKRAAEKSLETFGIKEVELELYING
ncbi:thioredoxin family protein [Ammoniphilus sp. CFH 90114]|uniref:thioredoxin family protein n=1 Tax=Ammoniphilus sp. CFH 90114 TaxID=2493665 RepID=UPI00100F142B|nr:thioredoxin family protein [Ammoniphilus sp. CFH 90114]RXT07929.1 thioredoxin [Ammoniphilus sp. CFH 90114]